MVGRAQPELRRRVRDDAIQVHGLGIQRHPAGLHPIEIEHVGDEPREATGIFVDIGGVLPHHRHREVLVAHHFAEPLNTGERCAELVTYDRHELAPQLTELLDLAVRLARRAVRRSSANAESASVARTSAASSIRACIRSKIGSASRNSTRRACAVSPPASALINRAEATTY